MFGQRLFRSSVSLRLPTSPFHLARRTAVTNIAGDDFLKMLQRSPDVVVIDVREPIELAGGRLEESFVRHDVQAQAGYIPLGDILEGGALAMDAESFEEEYGFAKPSKDEIVVFSCAAGVRSASACQIAEEIGFTTNPVNYVGGWNEWSHLFHNHDTN